jgi:predicted GNAT family acetyltransferase
MYRTALGKSVDMGSLLLKNEDVRAVGNMGVNARGDVINKTNDSVTSKAQQVNQVYRKQIRNQIEDVPVGVKKPIEDDIKIEGFDTPLEVQDPIEESSHEEPVKEEEEQKNTKTTKPKKGGLASAIAKAREVEQKKLQTPREESRGKKGVKKI